MKMKTVKSMVYIGKEEKLPFVIGCQAYLLTALKKRGVLTDKELEKGLSILKERNP
ncbi:MAG: hypothetical protein GX847_12930 [Clostridiales bacterium]|nr:hypothetical protein [Clostridiales bacterium]